ncbi:MAG: diguanylate cyclase [Desulfuromonadales bacterium]|nr:diguanylate cyclase [Desulfuromonadales bacterium]
MSVTSNRILIVQPDPVVRQQFVNTLSKRYTISVLDTGEAVLQEVASDPPDLVLLDIDLPEMNGIEVCRRLKQAERTKRIPVIMVSPPMNQEEIILGLQAGADDYLTRPLIPPEVLARIDAHLRYRNYYADLEHTDLQMLLELYDTVFALRNPMKILQVIVDRLAALLGVERCSIVSVGGDDEVIVKASNHLHENPDLRLALDRYPEIRKALQTRKAVVINDIGSDPLMQPVAANLNGINLQSMIVVPVIKKESVIGTLFLGTATSLKEGISERVYKLCHLVANISANALENAILFESVQTAKEFFEEMAIRDGLTRLYNHRHFYDRLGKEFSRTRRHKEPLSLIFFDIDDFKVVNDIYGHMLGDEVLKQIGRIIREVARLTDIPARYGGEEFAILLPNTPAEGALTMAQRLSTAIGECRFAGLGEGQVTISTGVATFTGTNLDRPDQLVEYADQGMYHAKSRGKNRVMVMQPDEEEEENS